MPRGFVLPAPAVAQAQVRSNRVGCFLRFSLSSVRYTLYKAAVMLTALKSEWIKIGRSKEPLFSYA